MTEKDPRGTYKWRQLAQDQLRREPLCRHCAEKGFTRAAEEVDHIVGVRKDPSKAFDISNLQSLCRPCHREKSRYEDQPKKRFLGVDMEGRLIRRES